MAFACLRRTAIDIFKLANVLFIRFFIFFFLSEFTFYDCTLLPLLIALKQYRYEFEK